MWTRLVEDPFRRGLPDDRCPQRRRRSDHAAGDRRLHVAGAHATGTTAFSICAAVTGRHALELCRRGFGNCTVLDYSQPLIDIGKREAD
jgi:hypothetical protein